MHYNIIYIYVILIFMLHHIYFKTNIYNEKNQNIKLKLL